MLNVTVIIKYFFTENVFHYTKLLFWPTQFFAVSEDYCNFVKLCCVANINKCTWTADPVILTCKPT